MLSRLRRWLNIHGPLAAFLILAVIGGYAIYASATSQTNSLYKSQIAGCERQNDVRRESNARIPAHDAEKEIVRQLLVTAQAAREASNTPADRVAAASYGELIHQLDTQVTFRKIPLIDCKKAIPKP